MKSFAELTRREKGLELFRWTSVLPAAVLVSAFFRNVVAYLSAVAEVAGNLANTGWFDFVRIVVYYVTKETTLVTVGSFVAPRHRWITTIVLGTGRILMGFIIHLGGQHFRSTVNYIHFAAETIGVLLGVCLVYCILRAKSRQPRTIIP